MFIKLPPIYLASQSPRRQALLNQIGIDFSILTVDVDEAQIAIDDPETQVLTLAKTKAQAGFKHGQQHVKRPVLGADTIVVCEQQILGKPQNQADAVRMLQLLSGTTHVVLTAVALVTEAGEFTCLAKTDVTLCPLTEEDCIAYWQTGEPRDKAGAYAIQGIGAIFVETLQGSYSNVVGLPLFETFHLLTQSGLTRNCTNSD